MAKFISANSRLGLGSALGISLGCSLGFVALFPVSTLAAASCDDPSSGSDAVVVDLAFIADDYERIFDSFAESTAFSETDAADAISDGTIADEYIHCQSVFGEETGVVISKNGASLSFFATARTDAVAKSLVDRAGAVSSGEISELRGVHQYAGSVEDLSFAALINGGDIDLRGSIDSHARASGDTAESVAAAESYELSGVSQQAISDTGVAFSVIDNSRLINAETANRARSEAVGDEATSIATASAVDVMGIRQGAETFGGDAISLIENQGTVRTSSATLSDSDARGVEAQAWALTYSAGVFGIGQAAESWAGNSTAIVENSRNVVVRTDNTARATTVSPSGSSGAFAGSGALGVTGIAQYSDSEDGDSMALVENRGQVAVSLSASARADLAADSGASIALAGALRGAGIGQTSGSDTGRSLAALRNTGSVSIQAAVDSSSVKGPRAGTGLAAAIGGVSEIYAIVQEAETSSGPRAEGMIENTGLLSVGVSVEATGTARNTGGNSIALIEASDIAGIRQVVEAERGRAAIDNTGLVWVRSNVRAVGSSLAGAQSSVAGISQEGMGDDDQLLIRNAGRILVDTVAEARSSPSASALVQGAGIRQILDQGIVQVDNTGLVLVDVTARADGAPIAEASGLVVEGGNAEDGSEIRNSGEMIVSAIALDGVAEARGVYLDLDRFSDEIRNIGSNARLETLAVGADTQSVAIGFADGTEIGPGTVLVNDSGRIIAGRSDRVGGALLHGTAISLIDSDGDPLPGAPATVRLMGTDGPGAMFGKINIRPGDLIAVSDGMTVFNGVVNNPVRRGSMTIADDGVFVLARDAVNGAAQVNVDRFEQAADGTLIFEMGASPDRTVSAGPPGNVIGQINANTVLLDGAMELRLDEGLYGNVVTFRDLVTATDSIDGEWSAITVSSPLFSARGTLGGRSGRSLGLRLDRIGFGDVGGLTRNQQAAGRGIDGSYEALLAGGHADTDYAAMVRNLFRLDADQYRDVMENLHGAAYAQGLGSIKGSLDLLARAVSSRLDGGRLTAIGFDQPAESGANRDGLSAMWIAPQGAWSDVTGDAEAPGFVQTSTGIHAGVEHQFTPNIRAGLVGGYFSAAMDFDNDRASLNYGGHQAGVFGQFDQGPAYLRGLAAYGRYRGNAWRFVDVGSAQGTLTGDFDAEAWRAEVEAGHDLTVTDGLTVTPFAGLAFAAGRYQAFEEQDEGTGAALRVSGGSQTVTSDLGLRFEERVDWGGGQSLRLGARASWLRDLTGTPARFDASFAGIGDSGFSVRGSDRSPDTAAIDLDMSWTWSDRESGATMAGISAGYSGRFNADATVHGLSARATLRF